MSEQRKIYQVARVLQNERIGVGIYSLWIQCPKIAKRAIAGQFLSVYCEDQAHLLPRPISICEIDAEEGSIRLVYRVVGYGTEEFSKLQVNDRVTVLGPNGNGFPLFKNGIVIGGGIGIPPMLELAKHLEGETHIILGYKDEIFLRKEMEAYGQVYVSTEDGVTGTKGTVIDVLKEEKIGGDVIYACGPMAMLRGVKAYAIEHNLPCYLSLEEKMACGVGACLGCTCSSVEEDYHSKVRNKRVCEDGPVFEAREVEI